MKKTVCTILTIVATTAATLATLDADAICRAQDDEIVFDDSTPERPKKIDAETMREQIRRLKESGKLNPYPTLYEPKSGQTRATAKKDDDKFGVEDGLNIAQNAMDLIPDSGKEAGEKASAYERSFELKGAGAVEHEGAAAAGALARPVYGGSSRAVGVGYESAYKGARSAEAIKTGSSAAGKLAGKSGKIGEATRGLWHIVGGAFAAICALFAGIARLFTGRSPAPDVGGNANAFDDAAKAERQALSDLARRCKRGDWTAREELAQAVERSYNKRIAAMNARGDNNKQDFGVERDAK